MEIVFDNIVKISTNKIYAGIHWRVRKTLKDNYKTLTNKILNTIEPIEGKVDLHFDFYFKGKTLDSSNCSLMAKILEDCMVEKGILKDDRAECVGNFSVKSHPGKVAKDYCRLTIN